MIEKSFKVGTKMPTFPEESSKIELKTELKTEKTIYSLSNLLDKNKLETTFRPMDIKQLVKSVHKLGL